MTLVLGTALYNKFVAMSSDTRRVMVEYWHYPETNTYEKKNQPAEASEGEYLKVVKLSDYALMGVGGIGELGTYLKEEMSKSVLPFEDLAICKIKLESLIQKARSDHDLKYSSFLNQEGGIQVVIMGFYHGGATGIVAFDSGDKSEVIESITDFNSGWQYGLISPVKKYLAPNVKSELFKMPRAKMVKKKENIKKIQWIHKLISKAHPVEVSSDGVMHVLARQPDGTIKHTESKF